MCAYLGEFTLGEGLGWLAHGEATLSEWLGGVVGHILASLTIDHVLNKSTGPSATCAYGLGRRRLELVPVACTYGL